MGLMPSGNSEELSVELNKYQVKEANMDATERDVNYTSTSSAQASMQKKNVLVNKKI